MNLDKYNIYSEGEVANPIELTDKGFIDVARLEPGGSFGALALIDGKPRMCTTKTLTRCHFLILNKADWKKAEKNIQKRKIEDKVNFIKRIPIFGKLSRTYLQQRLMPNFFELNCTRDFIVFKEGDAADRVYIIKEGEFMVTKRLIHKFKEEDNI